MRGFTQLTALRPHRHPRIICHLYLFNAGHQHIASFRAFNMNRPGNRISHRRRAINPRRFAGIAFSFGVLNNTVLASYISIAMVSPSLARNIGSSRQSNAYFLARSRMIVCISVAPLSVWGGSYISRTTACDDFQDSLAYQQSTFASRSSGYQTSPHLPQ